MFNILLRATCTRIVVIGKLLFKQRTTIYGNGLIWKFVCNLVQFNKILFFAQHIMLLWFGARDGWAVVVGGRSFIDWSSVRSLNTGWCFWCAHPLFGRKNTALVTQHFFFFNFNHKNYVFQNFLSTSSTSCGDTNFCFSNTIFFTQNISQLIFLEFLM